MLPLFLVVFAGGYVLLAGCFIIGLLAIREFFNGFENIDIKPSKVIAYISAISLYKLDLLSSLGVEFAGISFSAQYEYYEG